MKTCPKCNFQNNSSKPIACPKCSIIYAEVANAYKHRSVESHLSEQLERTLRGDEEISVQSNFTNKEKEFDQTSYPVVQNLSISYNVFAVITAAAGVVGTISLWSYLKALPFFSATDRYVNCHYLSAVIDLSHSTYLTIGWGLKMRKDIADNTRTNGNYLVQPKQTKDTEL